MILSRRICLSRFSLSFLLSIHLRHAHRLKWSVSRWSCRIWKRKRWIIIDTLLLFLNWKANSRCLREDSTTQDSFQSRSLSDPGKQRRESCWIADELTSFTQIMIGGRASVKWITGTRLLSYSEGQHRFPHEKDDQAYVQEIVHRYRTLWRSSSDPCHKNWSPTIRNAFVHSLQERSRRRTFCLLVSFNDR